MTQPRHSYRTQRESEILVSGWRIRHAPNFLRRRLRCRGGVGRPNRPPKGHSGLSWDSVQCAQYERTYNMKGERALECRTEVSEDLVYMKAAGVGVMFHRDPEGPPARALFAPTLQDLQADVRPTKSRRKTLGRALELREHSGSGPELQLSP